MEENELETTPQTTTEEASSTTEEAVQEVKQEVDKRDEAILEELRNIHNAINAQTEHHVRHLESHAMQATPVETPSVQEAASTTEHETENLPDEPVNLSINEPKDLPKEKKEEHKKPRRFGKRGKRA